MSSRFASLYSGNIFELSKIHNFQRLCKQCFRYLFTFWIYIICWYWKSGSRAVMYTRIRSLSCFKGHEVDFQINYIKDEFLFDHVFYTTSIDFVYDTAFFPRSLSNDLFIFFRVSIVIIYYFNYPLLFLYNHNERILHNIVIPSLMLRMIVT